MKIKTIPEKRKSRLLAVQLVIMAAGMFAFGFLVLPPIYNVFCEVTGLGGKTNGSAVVVAESPEMDRSIRLQFVTTVNEYAPWEFRAETADMTIHPGTLYDANFIARNLAGKSKIAQAVPSIAPQEAAKYFKKLECFCFTTQDFAAGEEKRMPVRFIVENDLPKYIDTITLSYTFFDTARLSDNSTRSESAERADQPAHENHARQ
jgi:cytochrome c oxidase assembly protein subunit 11